jgi:hypothetical protein
MLEKPNDKNAEFFQIWLNFCRKIADQPFWDLATAFVRQQRRKNVLIIIQGHGSSSARYAHTLRTPDALEYCHTTTRRFLSCGPLLPQIT